MKVSFHFNEIQISVLFNLILRNVECRCRCFHTKARTQHMFRLFVFKCQGQYRFINSLVVQFARDKGSILAAGDISAIIPDEDSDVAILEEPEHLTWYHHGKGWKTKFRLVIGIIHTNYLEYVRREKNGRLKAYLLKYVNTWVVSIYCHKVSLDN